MRDSDVQLLVRNMIFTQAGAYAWGLPPAPCCRRCSTTGRTGPSTRCSASHVTGWRRTRRRSWIWWPTAVPRRVLPARAAHEAIGRRAHQEPLRWLDDILRDPQHRVRDAIDGWLVNVAVRMREDPEMIAKVEQFKYQMLESDEVQSAVASLWPATKKILLEALADPDGELHRRAGRCCLTSPRSCGSTRTSSTGWIRISDGVAYVANRYGREATSLITDTVERWDASEASERIELAVGKDLQFIRINGTVVGALAGVLIYAVGTLVIG